METIREKRKTAVSAAATTGMSRPVCESVININTPMKIMKNENGRTDARRALMLFDLAAFLPICIDSMYAMNEGTKRKMVKNPGIDNVERIAWRMTGMIISFATVFLNFSEEEVYSEEEPENLPAS